MKGVSTGTGIMTQPQPAHARVGAHDVRVGHLVRAADLVDAVSRHRQFEGGHEVREHVVDGDGLRRHLAPSAA